MPGFSIDGDGDGPNSLAEVRRTHRWLFSTLTPLNERVLLVLKSASRPVINFEEPPMHHNQEQIYFAGKHTWEPLNLSWYDVEQDPDVSAAMYEWVENCLNVKEADVSAPGQYKKTRAELQMQDGQGNANEAWAMLNCWPQNVNWNALDYQSTDLQLIEVKLRYDRAVRQSA